MPPVEPVWVGVAMTIGGIIGNFIPKLSSFFTDRKKENQDDIDFIIRNYKGMVETQDQKNRTLETNLVEVQQKLVDIQQANVHTLLENIKMKDQIQMLTTENNALRLKV